MARKLICALLIAIGLSSAQAATMRGQQDVCSSFAVTSYDVAQMRDSGITWDVFAPWITERLNAALTEPRSYIKDTDDVLYVLGWFKRIWDEPQLEAMEIVGLVEADCMKTPASFKQRGKKQA